MNEDSHFEWEPASTQWCFLRARPEHGCKPLSSSDDEQECGADWTDPRVSMQGTTPLWLSCWQTTISRATITRPQGLLCGPVDEAKWWGMWRLYWSPMLAGLWRYRHDWAECSTLQLHISLRESSMVRPWFDNASSSAAPLSWWTVGKKMSQWRWVKNRFEKKAKNSVARGSKWV